MMPFYQNLLTAIAKKNIRDKFKTEVITDIQLKKQMRVVQVDIRHAVKEFFLIIIGVFSAGFGLKGFLLPNNFIDGGATGISLLVSAISDISLPYLLILVNLPFLILATKTINVRFAVKSILAITLLAFVVHSVDYPTITSDKLLIAVFGGFFLGLGIGMSIRGGSVIDGTEVLAIYLSRKLSLTIGDVLLLINIIIFSFGAYVLSIEIALYAILTYLSAAKTVDYVVDGVEEYVGVTIISKHSEVIRTMIVEKLLRACTIYTGKGGYNRPSGQSEIDILYTVITRLELAKLNTEIDKIDTDAFVVMGLVKDLKGGMIKRKPLK